MVGIITYTASIGQHFRTAIREMAELANSSNTPVRMDFNGKEHIVNPGVNVDDVVEAFEKRLREEEEAYHNSAEYKERQRLWQIERQAQIDKFHALWVDKPDFNSFDSVIDWLCKLSECDSINMAGFGILELFEKNGFLPNAYTYDLFDEDSREIFARWLIGQALDGIKVVGAIHPIFTTHAQQWRDRKFER